MEAYEETTGKSFGRIDVIDFLSSNTNNMEARIKELKLTMEVLFSPKEIKILQSHLRVQPTQSIEESDKLFYGKLKNLTLDQITSVVHGTSHGTDEHKEKMKRFLKFTTDTPKGSFAYAVKESARNKFFGRFQNQYPKKYDELIFKSFEKTAEKLKLKKKSFVGLSIPPTALTPTLRKLRNRMASRFGNTFDFYLSLSRGNIMRTSGSFHKKFQEKTFNDIEEARKQGWLKGVDVTGSINESTKELKTKEIRNIQDAFRKLAKSLDGNSATVMRIHAFEATNQGGFYKELYKFLESLANNTVGFNVKPPIISIGHIAAIDDNDIRKFSEVITRATQNNVPLKIIFDANVLSNYELQHVDRMKMIDNIQKLTRAGFEVGFGSDGSGILGRKSSVAYQLDKLSQYGLPRSIAYEVLQNSNRAPNCDPTPSQLLLQLTND